MESLNKDVQILKLFPEYVLQTVLPSFFSKIIPFLDSQKLIGPEKANLHDFGDHSENTQILNNPECKDISEYILKLASKFGVSYLNFNHKKYKFSQSWVSIKYPNNYHAQHSHSNSLISGVFYYGDFKSDTSGIKFHSTSPFNVSRYILEPSYQEKNNTDKEVVLKASPGLLYMFPSYLAHSVPRNKTKYPRKSVAFNIIPQDGFGNIHSLNRIEFET